MKLLEVTVNFLAKGLTPLCVHLSKLLLYLFDLRVNGQSVADDGWIDSRISVGDQANTSNL